MQELDDIALLRQYTENNSEEAFATLVTRHINKVYSVALRHTRNPHQAEEITQAVFVILAKKARTLGKNVIVSGWLYQTARLTSVTFLRSEIRRSHREQEAHMQNISNEPAVDETWKQIAPLLDTAMAGLNDTDRHAVVLRFFDGKSMHEVGATLGASEEAAKKRVNRALEKLRKFFTKRGVISTTAVIGAAISANSVQAAPAALANSVTAAAIFKGATATVSTLTLVKGAMKVMAWTKATTTATVITAGILLAIGTTIAVREVQEHKSYPWQVADGNSDAGVAALNNNPPQITIVPSKYEENTGHGILIDDMPPQEQWRYIGIHATPAEMIEQAEFNGTPLTSSQILWPDNMPGGYYDYIANLKTGSQQALQALIKKKFNLAGTYELRNTNVLLLELDHPNAPGLKTAAPLPAGEKRAKALITNQTIHYKNISMNDLALRLTWRLQIPVINWTGLAGNYDMDIPAIPDGETESPDDAGPWLFDNFGLKLIATNMPVETLVVEKGN